MRLIDIHAHLNFLKFDSDREEVIRRLQEADFGVINVGTDLETSRGALALAEKYERMWTTVGLHPNDCEEGFNEEAFRGLAQHRKVVAIGECGLDSVKLRAKSEKEKQAEIFVRQIALANELNKPLMLHIRNAYRDAYEVVKREAKVFGNVHFFSGTWAEAKKFLDLGFALSFAGPITFSSDYDEVIKKAPAEMIMAETDSPFAAPRPWRGRRNEPLYVQEVVRRLAALRGQEDAEMAAIVTENARRLFGLA